MVKDKRKKNGYNAEGRWGEILYNTKRDIGQKCGRYCCRGYCRGYCHEMPILSRNKNILVVDEQTQDGEGWSIVIYGGGVAANVK